MEGGIKNKMIVKQGEKWAVKSKSGKMLGLYSSRAQAAKRLKQVEMFKHMKSGKK